MDTDAARRASDEISAGAGQITGLAQRLDGVLHSLEWVGPDADRVRQSWQDQERSALDATAAHLQQLVTAIRAEAQQQDDASSVGSLSRAGGAGGVDATAATGADTGIVGWLDRHLAAYGAGVVRTLEADADLGGKLLDVLTGTKEWPIAAIAASAGTAIGAGVGADWNLITGTDNHWFDEAPGAAGTPVAVATDPSQASAYHPVLTQPTDVPSLMQSVSDGYTVGSDPGDPGTPGGAPASTGDIRIIRVDNGGTTGYVVAVPGTETWSPTAGAQPHDLTANVAEMADNPSAASGSVLAAMDAAHIPAGSPVLLVGHSQGGIGIAQIASDPALVSKYDITNAITYGSPIDQSTIDPSVNVLQLQHEWDVVPRLDLGGVRADGTVPVPETDVVLPSPGAPWQFGVNHSYSNYQQSVSTALAGSTPAGDTIRSYTSTLTPFLVGPGGSATAVELPLSRPRTGP